MWTSGSGRCGDDCILVGAIGFHYKYLCPVLAALLRLTIDKCRNNLLYRNISALEFLSVVRTHINVKSEVKCRNSTITDAIVVCIGEAVAAGESSP